MTVWFDVEDLYQHFRGGNRRISGIQRLTYEIYRAAQAIGGVRFLRHGDEQSPYEVLEWSWIAAAFERAVEPKDELVRPGLLTRPEPDDEAPEPLADEEEPPPPPAPPRSALRRGIGRAVNVLPGQVRRPLVLASVMQVQVLGELGRVALRAGYVLARDQRRAMRRRAKARAARKPRTAVAAAAARAEWERSFDALARPGDVLLVLGSPWHRQRYSELARMVRDTKRMRFGVLVHDLVPIRRPEWCDAGMIRMFTDWYADVLPCCDVVLANSNHTAADVEAYAREIGLVLPRPVRAVPVGTGFGAAPAVQHGPPGDFVLFVSTMEARKNHALMVQVWLMLLEEERTGARPVGSVPDLVFSGRVGWLVRDLMQQLDNTRWLDGRARMIHEPTDAELRALYAGCLFTVFPSFHEGWGLPVTESLSLGTPCLTSNAGALPEAGGPLCRYFDPEDVNSAYRAVAALLDDRAGLEAWRAEVRREFRPTPWRDTAQAVLDEATAPVD